MKRKSVTAVDPQGMMGAQQPQAKPRVKGINKQNNYKSMFGMDYEDFKNAIEKAISEDEIKRMMLDDNLDETQRCLTLIKKSDDN
jgi:hypothetical protein